MRNPTFHIHLGDVLHPAWGGAQAEEQRSGAAMSERVGVSAGHSPAIRVKIGIVFEFMPLTSAPGRIRTCAHGSGGRSCSWLPPGKTRAGLPVGERMGGAQLAGSAWRFPGVSE